MIDQVVVSPPKDAHFHYHTVRKVLHNRFPKAFPARNAPTVPLKIGISQDIIASSGLGIPPSHLRKFLYIWTSRLEYLLALVNNPLRIGLDGKLAGDVSVSARSHAKSRLESKEARDEKRREQKQKHLGSTIDARITKLFGGDLRSAVIEALSVDIEAVNAAGPLYFRDDLLLNTLQDFEEQKPFWSEVQHASFLTDHAFKLAVQSLTDRGLLQVYALPAPTVSACADRLLYLTLAGWRVIDARRTHILADFEATSLAEPADLRPMTDEGWAFLLNGSFPLGDNTSVAAEAVDAGADGAEEGSDPVGSVEPAARRA